VKTYTNRELSVKFNVNFQRWKRLSRAFLLPEDITSLPKGKARKYTFSEVLRVYLGVCLIDLGFSIIESQRIIDDLFPWFKEREQWLNKNNNEPDRAGVKEYLISIFPIKSKCEQICFNYEIRGNINCEEIPDNRKECVMSEKFITKKLLKARGVCVDLLKPIKVLNIHWLKVNLALLY